MTYLRYREEEITNTETRFAFKQTVKIVQQFVFLHKDEDDLESEDKDALLEGRKLEEFGYWVDIPTEPKA